jgi:putative ABC transport system substrate-binding protein
VNGLRDVGLTEGRNVKLDYRWGANDVERLRAFASELVALTPDVLLAGSTPPLAALRQATTTISIVFVLVSDPGRRRASNLNSFDRSYRQPCSMSC